MDRYARVSKGYRMGQQQTAFSGPMLGLTLLDMIAATGSLNSLVLCLDPADIVSYDGTNQTWTDRSGSGNHFFLGTTGGADVTDPTFVGTPGKRSVNEYFQTDGGDFFQENAAHTWAETWHKDNAAFTFMFVMFAMRSDTDGTTTDIFSNGSSTLTVGTTIDCSATSGNFGMSIANGSGFAYTGNLKSNLFPIDRAWVGGIISVDEAAGNILVKTSSAPPDLLTGQTWTAPSAEASTDAYQLWHDVHFGSFWDSGVQFGPVAAWNRVLTSTELDDIWMQLRRRYPLS